MPDGESETQDWLPLLTSTLIIEIERDHVWTMGNCRRRHYPATEALTAPKQFRGINNTEVSGLEMISSARWSGWGPDSSLTR